MASPTEAEIQSQWKNAVELLHETYEFGSVNAENWVGKEDTLVQSIESDYNAEILSSMATARSRLQGVISPEMAKTVILPHLKGYIKHIVGRAAPDSEQEIIDVLYRWFLDNSITVKSRGFVYGNPAAGGSNQGNVVILRVTKDENNFDLENAHAELKRADCVFDQNTGTERDQEIWRFRGSPRAFDSLQLLGSDLVQDIRSISGRSSLLRNTSFDSAAGTDGAPTSIPDWTSSVAVSGTTYEFDTTNFYRSIPGVTPRSLKIKTTSNLTQKLSTGNIRLNSGIPYYFHIVYNRAVGSAAGDLVVRLGSISRSVTLAAQTGWNVFTVPASPGQSNWYKSFDEQDLDISIEWTRTSGDLLIDDVILAPYSKFDGTWYAVVAANTSHTPPMKDDLFTWTDSIATDSVLQQWIWRAFGRYFPHAGSPTITDP